MSKKFDTIIILDEVTVQHYDLIMTSRGILFGFPRSLLLWYLCKGQIPSFETGAGKQEAARAF